MIKNNPILFFTILCGLVVFIAAINISLFSALKSKSIKKSPMQKSIFERAKSPWEPEDKALSELSDLVDQLKERPSQPDEKSPADMGKNH